MFHMSTSSLLLSVLFGAIGTAYFIYGKRQESYVPLFAGIGLFVFPMFISNVWLMLLTGVALSAAPFLISI
ncbi:MAG: hypothetical protein P8009_02350 [Gammaproteobacteria bacterium]